MAEIIGIISGIITLAHGSIKICDLISNKNDSPELFGVIAKRLLVQTRNLEIIKEKIRSQPAQDWVSIKALVDNCRSHMTHLKKLVEKCRIQDEDKWLEKIWKKLVSASREESASKIVDNLTKSLDILFQNNMLSKYRGDLNDTDKLEEFAEEVQKVDPCQDMDGAEGARTYNQTKEGGIHSGNQGTVISGTHNNSGGAFYGSGSPHYTYNGSGNLDSLRNESIKLVSHYRTINNHFYSHADRRHNVRPASRQSFQHPTSTSPIADIGARDFAPYPPDHDILLNNEFAAATVTWRPTNETSPLLRHGTSLFDSLNGTHEHIIIEEKEKGYWCVLSGTALKIYKKIYNSCKDTYGLASYSDFRSHIPPETATNDRLRRMWEGLHEGINSPVNTIRHQKPIVLAITFMLHVEKFYPEAQGKWRIDSKRRAGLERFDEWIKCNCSSRCVREWNFANDIGISRTSNSHVKKEKCRVYRLVCKHDNPSKDDLWIDMRKQWDNSCPK